MIKEMQRTMAYRDNIIKKDNFWHCMRMNYQYLSDWYGFVLYTFQLTLFVHLQEVLLFPAMKPDDNKTSAPTEGTSV